MTSIQVGDRVLFVFWGDKLPRESVVVGLQTEPVRFILVADQDDETSPYPCFESEILEILAPL